MRPKVRSLAVHSASLVRALCVALVLIAFAPSSLAQRDPLGLDGELLPHLLQGRLIPEYQLRLSGQVEIVEPEAIQVVLHPRQVDPAASTGPLYEAPYAYVSIEEWHWMHADGRDFGFYHVDSGEGFRDIRVILDRLKKDPEWLLIGADDAAQTSYSARVHECRVGVGEKTMPTIGGRLVNTNWESVWNHVGNILEAECALEAFHVDGRVTYYVTDTVLTIKGFNVDNGKSESRTLETGVVSRTVAPGVEHHVLRVVSFRSSLEGQDHTAILRADGDVGATFRTPVLAVQGRTDIPTSQGWVQWERWFRDGSIEPLAPEGSLTLAAHEGGRIGIAGVTSNAPHQTAVAAGGGLGPTDARIWTGLAVAAALAILWKLIGAGLFARVTGSKLLEHPARRFLFDVIDHNPGIGLAELTTIAGLPRSTVRHHVRLLLERGLISAPADRRASFFVRGKTESAEQAVIATLRKARVQEILDLLKDKPDIRQKEIAARVGVSRAYVNRVLWQLVQRGMLTVSKIGRTPTFRIIPEPDSASRATHQ